MLIVRLSFTWGKCRKLPCRIIPTRPQPLRIAERAGEEVDGWRIHSLNITLYLSKERPHRIIWSDQINGNITLRAVVLRGDFDQPILHGLFCHIFLTARMLRFEFYQDVLQV